MLQNAQESVFVTRSFSVMLGIISITRRFRIFRRFKKVHFQDFLQENLASFVSMVVDWSRLICSRKILALRWFSVGVFSLGILRTCMMLHLEAKKNYLSYILEPRKHFLDEKETDFPFEIFLQPLYNVRIISIVQSPPCPLGWIPLLLWVSSKSSCSFYIGPGLDVADRLPTKFAHMPLGDL